MRNKIIILLLIIISFNSIQAQTDSNYIVKPKWKKGEVKTIKLTQSVFFINDTLSKYLPSDTFEIYTIKVIDVLKDGYILELKQISKSEKDNELKKYNDIINRLKFVLLIDTLGKVKELQNWKLLVEVNKDLIKFSKEESSKNTELELMYKRLINQLGDLNTKDKLTEASKNATDIFLSLYGEHLKLFDSISAPSTVPNKLIKEGIPTTKITVTNKIDEDRFSIKYSNIYDTVKLENLKKRYYPSSDIDYSKTSSYSFFIYNNKTSWIEKIVYYYDYKEGSTIHTSITTHIIE